MAWTFLVALYFVSPDPPSLPIYGHQVTMEVRAQSAAACERFRAVIAKELIAFTLRHTISATCTKEAMPPDLPEGQITH